MTPIYAIGDVHGHFDKLAEAMDHIAIDGGRDAKVVLLGDLVDRGPDSFRVIEMLRLGVEEGLDWTVLRGNHDQMFLSFLATGEVHHPRVTSGIDWLDPIMGGAATLASYGVIIEEGMDRDAIHSAARAAVPDTHLTFLNACSHYLELEHFLFVHAGLRPSRSLADQDPEDLLWIREPFLSHSDPFEWLVVHGHTALKAPRRYANRVNLDSGAGFGRDLTVGVFEGDDVFTLGPSGRVPLELVKEPAVYAK